jgi:DNA-binding PucR family transcriptional regulator
VIVLADGRGAGVQRAGRPVATSATVGLGPAAPLGSITRPFAAARRAHDTAAALALRGNHTIEDLGLSPAVLADQDVGAAIAARYNRPLANLGSFGAILRDTVQAYFDEGMRLDLTARHLAVHQNTLLHRLRRFEEVTGADLRRVSTVAEVWWALQQQRMRMVDPNSEETSP